MSSPNISRKKPSETVSFLQITNPEIFKAQPRPGGVVQIKKIDFTESKKEKEKEEVEKPPSSTQVEPKVSREFRVQTALDEAPSVESTKEATLPNPLHDSIYMLGITISTIILMAANHSSIPNENLEWTKSYLECIRDEFGNHPPNVQGILNHIKFLSGGGKVEAAPPEGGEEGEGEEGGEKTVRSVTRVRVGSKDEE